MRVVLGGKYNLFSAVLDVTAKTLTISNVIGFDLSPTSLSSVYSTTQSKPFLLGRNVVSCTSSLVAGLPVWVYTFSAIPSGVINTDTLVILLDLPLDYLNYSIAAYQASKV